MIFPNFQIFPHIVRKSDNFQKLFKKIKNCSKNQKLFNKLKIHWYLQGKVCLGLAQAGSPDF